MPLTEMTAMEIILLICIIGLIIAVIAMWLKPGDSRRNKK